MNNKTSQILTEVKYKIRGEIKHPAKTLQYYS